MKPGGGHAATGGLPVAAGTAVASPDLSGGQGGASPGEVVPASGLYRQEPASVQSGGGAISITDGARPSNGSKKANKATHWTRLSCHRFRANEVRLQLSVLAYNLGNLWRRLVLPKRIDTWSLTSLQQRLVKTGGRLIKHAR